MIVKRYDISGEHYEVFGDNNGEYCLYEDYAALEARYAALAAENAGLNAFVDALLSIAWQGCGADGAEIQELALKNGLLRQEVYSSDEHETLVDDPGNFEDGDSVYFRVKTPATAAFLAEVRAQCVEMAAQSEQFSTWVQQGLRSFAIGVRQGDEQ